MLVALIVFIVIALLVGMYLVDNDWTLSGIGFLAYVIGCIWVINYIITHPKQF